MITVFRYFIINYIFFSTTISMTVANALDQDEVWDCYPAYSFQNNKNGLQNYGGMFCKICGDNDQPMIDHFMIIGKKYKNKIAHYSVIYSTDTWWKGCFLYHPKHQFILLAEQPDNANCTLRFFFLQKGHWNLSCSIDVFGLIDTKEWPEDKAWRGSVSQILYNESKNQFFLHVWTSQGNYEVSGIIKDNNINHYICRELLE